MPRRRQRFAPQYTVTTALRRAGAAFRAHVYVKEGGPSATWMRGNDDRTGLALS